MATPTDRSGRYVMRVACRREREGALINGENQELQIEVGRGRSLRLYIVVVYDPQSTSRVLRIKIQ